MTVPPTIVICEEPFELMWRAGELGLPVETGGILAGFRSGDGIVVTRAAVVADPTSSGRGYQLRDAYAESALADLRGQGAPLVGYVGDWHTHPADQPPSSLDLSSLKQAATASPDLIAQIVLPFHHDRRRPPHATIAHQRRRRGIIRRQHVILTSASIIVSEASPQTVEQQARSCWKEEQP